MPYVPHTAENTEAIEKPRHPIFSPNNITRILGQVSVLDPELYTYITIIDRPAVRGTSDEIDSIRYSEVD